MRAAAVVIGALLVALLVKTPITILGVLILVALLWNAAETYYRNCVAAAQASTAAPRAPSSYGGVPLNPPDRSRQRAVARCHRLPF